MTHILRRALIVAICSLGPAGLAAAQTTATLSGSIVDSSGALLPGVLITVRQLTTGFTRSATTAADGRFVVAGISAGPYELRAELSGFRPAMRADIVVTVGEVLALPPIALELGGVQEAVTVTGGAARVNTQTSELSYLVSEQAIATLPLNGRNYTDLTLLQPGVIAYPSRDGGSVVAHGLGMSVNGQDYRSNVYLLDGTLLNDFTNGPAGQRRGDDARHRIDPGVPRRIERLPCRVRPELRRPDERHHEVGNEHAARQRVRVPPQRRARRRQLLRRRRQTRLHAQSVRRRGRRTADARPPVLFRRLRSAPRKPRQDDFQLRARRQRAARNAS